MCRAANFYSYITFQPLVMGQENNAHSTRTNLLFK